MLRIAAAWILGAVAVIYFVYKCIDTLMFLHMLDKVPGPYAYPIIGNLILFLCAPEKIFSRTTEYVKQYYPIFRIKSGGTGGVLMVLPEDIEIVISGMKHLPKNEMYGPLHPWLKTGLLTSAADKWRTRRKILTPAFHFNILQQFTATFVEQSEKLASHICSIVDKPVDVVPMVSNCTLNTICETAMGTNLLSNNEFDKYREAIYKIGELVVFRIVRPWYHFRTTFVISPKFFDTWKVTSFLHKFSTKIINERKKNFKLEEIPKYDENDVYKSKRRMAMLDLLLTAKAEGADIDDNGIREEVDTFMFEGHDTTAMCISYTLMLLACNKEIQDKVVDELNDIFGESNRSVTNSDLHEMNYLERAIKESLRLYPTVPMFGRLLTETIKTHSGYIIPKGANVLVRVYDLHRNPEIYPDPEKFDPDRFLPENTQNKHPYAYLPFSAGPRNCIGQKFAMMELKTVMATILRKFEVKPVDTPETLTLISDLILHSKHGVKVIFSPRNEV